MDCTTLSTEDIYIDVPCRYVYVIARVDVSALAVEITEVNVHMKIAFSLDWFEILTNYIEEQINL